MPMRHLLTRILPNFTDERGKVVRLLGDFAQAVALPKGAQLFHTGHHARDVILLASGVVQVRQNAQSAHPFVMRRFRAPENRVVSKASLSALERHGSEWVAETEVEAILMSRDVLTSAMSISPNFRAALYQTYADRMTQLYQSRNANQAARRETCYTDGTAPDPIMAYGQRFPASYGRGASPLH